MSTGVSLGDGAGRTDARRVSCFADSFEAAPSGAGSGASRIRAIGIQTAAQHKVTAVVGRAIQVAHALKQERGSPHPLSFFSCADAGAANVQTASVNANVSPVRARRETRKSEVRQRLIMTLNKA